MATKLKNLRLTSVDLVRRGANQEADINLYKSADGTEQPTEQETGIFKRFLDWLRNNPTQADTEAHTTTEVEKDYQTFEDLTTHREAQDKLWRYTDALTSSIRSIQEDRDLSEQDKLQMMKESLTQFDTAISGLFEVLCSLTTGNQLVKSVTADNEEEEEDIETEDDDPEDVDKSAFYDEIVEV